MLPAAQVDASQKGRTPSQDLVPGLCNDDGSKPKSLFHCKGGQVSEHLEPMVPEKHLKTCYIRLYSNVPVNNSAANRAKSSLDAKSISIL